MATSLYLHIRPRKRPLSIQNPRFFSSPYSTKPPYRNDTESESQPQNNDSSSTFDYIKSHLKQPQQPKPFTSYNTNSQSQTPSKVASYDNIRKNLSEYRIRSGAPAPPPPSGYGAPRPQISFQELFKRNAEANQNADRKGDRHSADTIRQSLQKMRAVSPRTGESKKGASGRDHPMSLSSFKSSLKLTPPDWGSFEVLPSSVFGKEMRDKEGGEREEDSAVKTEFVKMYSYDELGAKLRKLRPEGVVKQNDFWFSLNELNERLVKLREIEEKESQGKLGGLIYGELRKSLVELRRSGHEKTTAKIIGVQRLDIWNELSGTPDYMKHPPKEHLVEKYFHPDNMSASEKLKIELTKVREDFKMSESDCGSARVQVAQLTTKIKYLSKALHKKDKHSRKGLIAMVQQRKKLLKYLRRTDWESYCLLLDKLGLRDNPDIKMLAA